MKRGVNSINHRTTLLVGGKQKKTRNGANEPFTILSSSHRKKNLLKVLVPNRDPTEDLYRLFPHLPPGEKPFNGYKCALHKDILLQGKLIVCTNCICFHSNIFGYETRLIIYFKNILAIKREKTAFVVPNAVSIRTTHKKYLFCSFLSRESVFKLLTKLWKNSIDQLAVVKRSFDEKSLSSYPRKKPKRSRSSDFNENRLCFNDCSSVCNASTTSHKSQAQHELPERPHSSPPSLNITPNNASIPTNSNTLFPLQNAGIYTTDSDADSENSSNSSDLYNLRFPNACVRMCDPLVKSNSVGDLRELASIGDRIGNKHVEKIGKVMYAKYQKQESLSNDVNHQCTPSTKFKCLLSYFFSVCSKIRQNNTTLFLLISGMFILMAVVSFALLLRINAISNIIQNQTLGRFNLMSSVPSTQHLSCASKHAKLHKLLHFRDDLHNAKIERMKSLLSTNLETINEVQEELRKLRDRLQ